MKEPQFLVHNDPVWRDKADFIIDAKLDEEDEPRFEQLWARQIDANHFELCCIPAYVYDLALGDIVVTSLVGNRNYVVDKVEVASGRFGFRAWLEGLTHDRPIVQAARMRDELVDELRRLGALVELVSPSLLAIDARDSEHAQSIADYLVERERRGDLLYETTRQP